MSLSLLVPKDSVPELTAALSSTSAVEFSIEPLPSSFISDQILTVNARGVEPALNIVLNAQKPGSELVIVLLVKEDLLRIFHPCIFEDTFAILDDECLTSTNFRPIFIKGYSADVVKNFFDTFAKVIQRHLNPSQSSYRGERTPSVDESPDLIRRRNQGGSSRSRSRSRDREYRHAMIQCLVPSKLAGLIVGRGGSKLQLIRDKTGAVVQIERNVIAANSEDRLVTISSRREEDILKVLDLYILDILGKRTNYVLVLAIMDGEVSNTDPNKIPGTNLRPHRIKGIDKEDILMQVTKSIKID
jgi:KH domain